MAEFPAVKDRLSGAGLSQPGGDLHGLALSQRVTICLAVHKPARYNWNGFSGTLAMWVRVVVAIGLLFLPTVVFAQAEKRIALLIGNQGYGGDVGRLANPHNDMGLLEKALSDLGLEVTTVRDAGLAGLHQAVNA